MPIDCRQLRFAAPGSPLAVALWAALVAAVLLGLAGMFAANRFSKLIDASLRADIVLDRRSLLADVPRLRIVAVVDAVDQRVVGHYDAGRPGLYVVADAVGRQVAGNLAGWPPRLPRAPGWHHVQLPPGAPGDRETRALILVEAVDGHWWLAVGRRLGPWDGLQRDMAWLTAGLVLAILAAAVGVALAAERRSRQEVAVMNAALSAFITGALSQRTRTNVRLSDPGRRALAAAIDATMAHVERLLSGMQRLSAAVAHELKSPLSRVRHLLVSGDRYAAMAELDSALHLIDALLDIAAHETGANIGARPCDLAETVSMVGALYGDVAEASGVTLAVEAAPAPALADGDLIARALANLTDNAIRHTPAGGRVTLSSRMVDGTPEVAVQDGGPGPPAASLTALAASARPGLRADGSRSVGMGLRLVQAIALRHGSEARISWQAPGHRITLELQPAHPAAEQP